MVADWVVMLVVVALVVAGLYYSDWAALGVWVAFVAGAIFVHVAFWWLVIVFPLLLFIIVPAADAMIFEERRLRETAESHRRAAQANDDKYGIQ